MRPFPPSRRRSVASNPLDGLLDFHMMVGARGFEPPTSCSQSRRATGLRYAPTARHLRILSETTPRSANHLYKNVPIRVQAMSDLDNGSAPHGSKFSSGKRPKNVGHGSEGLGSMTDTVFFFSRQLGQRTTEFRDEEHRVITKPVGT